VFDVLVNLDTGMLTFIETGIVGGLGTPRQAP
jgi:hypothetical protein